MKDTINGISRWVIAVFALMESYIHLTLNHDYVIWKRRKADYELRIPGISGLILGSTGQALFRPMNGGFLLF